MSNVDYKFYVERYKGSLPEKEFEKFVIQASQYLEYITMGKARSCTDDNAKYAACEIVEIYQKASSLKRVQNENTDGYSVTYALEGVAGELSETTRDKKAYQAARKWLIGTGLMNRRVGSHCDN